MPLSPAFHGTFYLKEAKRRTIEVLFLKTAKIRSKTPEADPRRNLAGWLSVVCMGTLGGGGPAVWLGVAGIETISRVICLMYGTQHH